MKEFEGLKIPESTELDSPLSVISIQREYCNSINMSCDDIGCMNCLFDNQNIKQFTKWYNLKK